MYCFTPDYQVIPAKDSAEIIIDLDCNQEEKIEDILEIMVQNSDSHFIKFRANIQEPKVCLNRYTLDMGRIYAGIQETVRPYDDNSIVLKNYGNIPVWFELIKML